MIGDTAGHVDHGKSALVRALTDVDPDRLAEEKRRGITIDLGFAYMPAPDGDVLGFVDVPGHEHFIHNMLAGATGIDFVLLTVAADDGVMPQTGEHLAIVDLLGLKRGIVALTKSDLVDASRIAVVKTDIAKLLAETGLAGSAIVETSTVSGQGVEELRAKLFAAARETKSRDTASRFRLAVDRCFTLRGVGTMVTGTVLSGAVSVGDQVTVSPSGLTARVRSIHAQNQPVERGVAGQRCALNLAGDGVAKDAIARGDMVLDPTLHAPTARIDARLKLLPSESVALWMPARLHHGAVEVGARLVPLGGGWVQLVLDRPIAAASGDPFVLRDTSGQRTIGGGRFVDLRAPVRKRRTPERLVQLDAMETNDTTARLLDLPPYYLDLAAYARDRALPANFGDALDVVRLGNHVLSQESWARFEASLRAALTAFHAANQDAAGATPDALRRVVEPRLPALLFAAALAELARRGIVAQAAGLVRLPDHATRLTSAQDALWQKIRPLLGDAQRFQPPRLIDLAKSVAASESYTRKALKQFAGLGLVEEVVPDHFFLREAVTETASIVAALGADGAEFGAAQLRDRLDTGRKSAIELLEYFDRRGVTLRRGDLRRVDARKLALLR
jgi:selenocysteine-specific elongation factor